MKLVASLTRILTIAAIIGFQYPEKIDAQSNISVGTCKFNKTITMKCIERDNGHTFSITWSDGVSEAYRWVGSNADRKNIEDSRGGSWHYYDYRNCRDFSLTNLNNGNVITFTGNSAAC